MTQKAQLAMSRSETHLAGKPADSERTDPSTQTFYWNANLHLQDKVESESKELELNLNTHLTWMG